MQSLRAVAIALLILIVTVVGFEPAANAAELPTAQPAAPVIEMSLGAPPHMAKFIGVPSWKCIAAVVWCPGKNLAGYIAAEGGELVADAASGFFAEIALTFLDGSMIVLGMAMSWWIWVPTELVQEDDIANDLAGNFNGLITLMIPVGVILAMIKMIWDRKFEPIAQIVKALLLYMLVVGSGIGLATEIISASDAWSKDIVLSAMELPSDAGRRDEATMTEFLSPTATTLRLTNVAVVFLLANVFIIVGLIQTVMMFFRSIGLFYLKSMFAVAAAGYFVPWWRHMFPSVIGKFLALVFWKPIAAITIAGALRLFNDSDSIGGFVAGAGLLVLAIFAIKPLMSLFAVITPQVANGGYSPSGGGGGTGAIGAIGGAALAAKAFGGGGSGGDDDSGATPPPPSSTDAIAGAAGEGPAAGAASAGGTAAAGGAAATGGATLVAAGAVEGFKAVQSGATAAANEIGDQ